MTTSASANARSTFADATAAFVDLMSQIEADAWERPGLGVWSVRGLVGHTSRALLTVESYLGTSAPGPTLDGPVAYFRAVSSAAHADEEAIAQRGRDAGAALGADPAASVAAIADRVTALVTASDDDAPIGSPIGAMTLAGYLPTRTFELTVHSLDLASALDLPHPPRLETGIRACLELAGQLAAASTEAPSVLMALTGRTALPSGFSLL